MLLIPGFLKSNSKTTSHPLRGDVLSRDLLVSRALELASGHTKVVLGGEQVNLRGRFRSNCRVLSSVYFSFSEMARANEFLPSGAEWLLDNFHVIDEQVREIRRDLPRRYYKALPNVVEEGWEGFPRVYRLVCDFITHTDSFLTSDSLSNYVSAYQSVCELKIGELWAIPIMLRLALIENLRRLSEQAKHVSDNRQLVDHLCKEIIDPPAPGGTDMMMRLVEASKKNPWLIQASAPLLIRRLRTRGAQAQLSLHWLNEELRERTFDITEVSKQEQQAQAADQISLGNCVTALKAISRINWRKWVESQSTVDVVMSGDPNGIYDKCDFDTRDMYRHKIELISRVSKKAEKEVATLALEFAKTPPHNIAISSSDRRSHHVGYFLVDDGFETLISKACGTTPLTYSVIFWLRKQKTKLYLLSIAALTAIITMAAFCKISPILPLWGLCLMVCCLLVLSSQLATQIVQWLSAKTIQPKQLAKLDLEKGVPAEYQTAVVVQSIVRDREDVEHALQSLHIRSIGNEDKDVSFGVLFDLCDASSESLPGDRGLIQTARDMLNELNNNSRGAKFFALFRKRQFNAAENRFMGWERKRGKLLEFNRLLRGSKDTSFSFCLGDLSFLENTKYVITLDSDTQLPPVVVRKLVGTIAHPLNKAIFDHQSRIVRKGYAIIQPRVSISLKSANASKFAHVFSGSVGLDPYTQAISDTYQDIFRNASYIGKGIYEVDAFSEALDGRFPENALLSHDLIESCYARCGLASDIELFDDFPQRYHAHAKRLQRWIRGDWQILPWLFNKLPLQNGMNEVSPIPLIGRWKIFDNLRRSILAPATVLSLAIAWSSPLAGSASWLWALVILTAFPAYSCIWQLFFGFPVGCSIDAYLTALYGDFRRQLANVMIQFALLPHQAAISLNAIFTTLYRLFISKRNLLEWETAATAERRLGNSLNDFFASMAPSYLLIVPTHLALIFSGNSSLLTPSLLLVSWYIAPIISWYLSQKSSAPAQNLTVADRKYLRGVAFDTWKYFEEHLVPQYNYLIPDNLQLVPEKVVAERTSPTNISLSLLSIMSAYDLGFVPLSGKLNRITNVVTSVEKLEKFEGHLMNWYEITSFRPLSPRYISAVDSGNFAGHLIAVNESLLRLSYQPIVSDPHVKFMLEILALEDVRPNLHSHVSNLEGVTRFFNSLSEIDVSKFTDESHKKLLHELRSEIDLVSWVSQLDILKTLSSKGLLPKKLKDVSRLLKGRIPTPSLLLKMTNRLLRLVTLIDEKNLEADEKTKLSALVDSLHNANLRLVTIHETTTLLCKRIDKIIAEMNFKFLFDKNQNLFVIGYNIDSGCRDQSHYDLLASEARLASLVGIAKGDLPQDHWFLLNRTLTNTPSGMALVSWSATMFEYLMPLLVMADFPSTILHETYHTVVRAQRFYAGRRGVPWGISESGYAAVDFLKNYQYRAFGIPGLGLKRGLGEELVVSPYSTLLAVMVDPKESVINLGRLEQEGLRGEYGFYEAVDYTAERLRADERCHILKSFLAHHQGMSLAAINNVLNDNILQACFHANPAIKACELLLQEKIPSRVPLLYPNQAEVLSLEAQNQKEQHEVNAHFTTPFIQHTRTHFLSNRSYNTIIDNAGGGASYFESDVAITRTRDDSLSCPYGTFFYIRDINKNSFWSSTYQPTFKQPEQYEVLFSPDKALFKRRDHELTSVTEVVVSPDDPVEIRRVTVTSSSAQPRTVEITSFGEIALAPFRADLAHPAFSRMFVFSEYLDEYDALLFKRRPRSEGERELYMMHMVIASVVFAPTQYETSRERFIGRGRSVLDPQAMTGIAPLSGLVGTPLDPIFSLRQRLELSIGQSQSLSFVTGAARSRDELISLIRKYREPEYVSRTFEMAWSHANVEMRHQEFSRTGIREFQNLANALLVNIDTLRAPSDLIRSSRLSQSGLWRFGISGDEPIVLLIINDNDQFALAQDLLLAHEYLRQRGLRFDLVILNEHGSGYFQNVQDELDFLIKSGFSKDLVDKRGGVFLRSKNQLSEEEIALIYATARVVIYGNKGSLSSQLQIPSASLPERDEQVVTKSKLPPSALPDVICPSVYGGFDPKSYAYKMRLNDQHMPPLPWLNVIANPNFGFMVSDSGGGYTWAENSRENRISPWSNDQLSEQSGEAIYVRDSKSKHFWSPTPLPCGSGANFEVTHGFGYSEFQSEHWGIENKLTISGSTTESVKWWNIKLRNSTSEKRTLEVFLYFEWVLGVTRQESYRHIRSGFDVTKQYIYAQNPFNLDFSGQIVFAGSNQKIHSYTAKRSEFIGQHASTLAPAIFLQKTPGLKADATSKQGLTLSNTTGAGFDTACVLKVAITLDPGEEQNVLFFLGREQSLEAATNVVSKYRSNSTFEAAHKEVRDFWTALTSTVQVKTPDESFNILTNGWLLYQTLSCRMWARSGFYQSSGALGFRDQLQDSMGLLYANPELSRRQILINCSRQFKEGDVQHWWHPPSGRGVRTRISDNYLWLPFAVLEYLRITADAELLNEQAPYLEGQQLEPKQMEAFFPPTTSDLKESVYQHCVRSLDRATNQISPRGIPLMGCGDWNDGMNAIGHHGQGESIWLGWFMADILKRFADLVDSRGDINRAQEYRIKSQAIVSSIETHAWDGKWYVRAFFDDGTPIGSHTNTECKMDSLAQSWSVITGLGEPSRQVGSMNEVCENLVDYSAKLIKLLTPAFQNSEPNPGYIQSYPEGIRENGGQYTHAATWVVMAMAMLGKGEKAVELFNLINPINHSLNKKDLEIYRTEPYVTCGDVYTHPQHNGRGGWSWYTGSSGWLYRIAIEHIAGLKIQGSSFTVEPCVSNAWKEFQITYRHKDAVYEIEVKNPNGVERGVKQISLDGQVLKDKSVPITGVKQTHRVVVEMG